MDEIKKQISLSIRARYSILYLLTWEENRAENLIQEVAQDLNKQVYSWSISEGIHPAPAGGSSFHKPEDALRFIGSCNEKAVFVLKDFHPFLEQELVVRLLRDLSGTLRRSFKTIILLSPELTIPKELEKDVSVFDLPFPNARELGDTLHKLLAPYKQSKDVKVDLSAELTEKVVRATLGLTKNEAENVYAKALLNDRQFSEDDLPDIIEEKKQLIRKSGLLTFIGFSTRMNNVGGLEALKHWLRRRSTAFTDKARQYGLPQPKGLLMVGVQGCGKSLSAKAIAAEWNLPLLRLDVGQIFDSFIGNSEANMRKAIALAEAMSPTILWLDEIEKGFAGTLGSGGNDSGVTARVFGTFLTWMQEKTKPVFVIATANNIEQLPPELLRKGRFDEIFFIDLPGLEERKHIFKIHIQLKKRDPEKFDIAGLAETANQFSGAEIEEAVVSSMYRGFSENREFNSDDILKSIQETVPLAVTARERIDELREWAKQRARPASLKAD